MDITSNSLTTKITKDTKVRCKGVSKTRPFVLFAFFVVKKIFSPLVAGPLRYKLRGDRNQLDSAKLFTLGILMWSLPPSSAKIVIHSALTLSPGFIARSFVG